MISKHIKHYLTLEGREYFMQWLEQLKCAQQETEGFEGILLGAEGDDVETTHLILQFDSRCGLDNWSHNDVHNQLLEDLQPYLEKPSKISYFEIYKVA